MTLAKTCYARLGKSNLLAYSNYESFLNRDVSMFHCCDMKKMNLVLKLKSIDAQ